LSPHYNIPAFKTISFTKDVTVPTGGIFIDGYLNDDKDLYFSAQISFGTSGANFEGTCNYQISYLKCIVRMKKQCRKSRTWRKSIKKNPSQIDY
jgi:Protein of unknown function (DUF1433).